MRAVAVVVLITLAAGLPAARGAGEADRIVAAVDAKLVEQKTRFALHELPAREDRPRVDASGLHVRMTLVPEILPALLEAAAHDPGVDFAGAAFSYAQQMKVVTGVDLQGRERKLYTGLMDLTLPLAGSAPAPTSRAADGIARLDAVRALRRLTTSCQERFLAGELWLLRDVRLESDGRVQVNGLAATPMKLLAGVRALATPASQIGALRLKRATREPYRDRQVWSFELQAVAGGPPYADQDTYIEALASILGTPDALATLPAPDGRPAVVESIRIEAPLPGGVVPVDFNLSGSWATVARLPAQLVAARLDARRGQISIAAESSGRLRMTFNAETSARTPSPVPYSKFIEVCEREVTAGTMSVRDLRIEGDGRVLMHVSARDDAALTAVLGALAKVGAALTAKGKAADAELAGKLL